MWPDAVTLQEHNVDIGSIVTRRTTKALKLIASSPFHKWNCFNEIILIYTALPDFWNLEEMLNNHSLSIDSSLIARDWNINLSKLGKLKTFAQWVLFLYPHSYSILQRIVSFCLVLEFLLLRLRTKIRTEFNFLKVFRIHFRLSWRFPSEISHSCIAYLLFI